MKKKYFVIIASIHILLVISDMIIYDYQQISDSLRYLFVANEFASFNFLHFNPAMNCNTAPGYPIFLALAKPITQNNQFWLYSKM